MEVPSLPLTKMPVSSLSATVPDANVAFGLSWISKPSIALLRMSVFRSVAFEEFRR